jgi:hypothetical protein
MGSSNSKVQCLLRPGQSGKTKKMQDLIREYADLANIFHGEGATPLDIVICSNNRSLAHQTTVRMNNDLFDSDSIEDDDSDDGPADAQLTGSCFSWVSGTKGIIKPEHLAWDIVTGKVSMVVCCAHKKRLDYVYTLLTKLNEFPSYRSKVNIWIDEADASIKLWSRPTVDVTLLSSVQTVTLVSATFNTILKKYERLHVLGDVITHPPSYHKVADCIQVVDDETGDAPAYLAAVLAKNPQLVQPGIRLFAPGDHIKISHNEVANHLLGRGFAVLVLNGSEKRIRMPGTEPSIVLADNVGPDPEEIGRQVARLYREHNLARFPFAVTGHQCVGRGLTFQNENFLFDFGIVPHISDPAMAYQTACRMAGNIRFLPGYKQVPLVTTTRMWTTLLRQEAFAVNLARIVNERNLLDVGVEEFDEAAGIVSAGSVRDYELSPTFATSAAAAAWCDRNLSYGKSVYGLYDAEGNAGLTHIKYRGHLRPLLTEVELRASVPATNHEGGNYARVMPVVDVQWGVADAARVMPVSWVGVPEGADKARVMPVSAQQVIVWVAIYKKDKRRAVTVSQLFGGR